MEKENGYINGANEIIIPSRQDLTISAESVKQDIRKYWDRSYINACIADIPNHNYKMLITFLWRTGVRITEAVSLRKTDIDFIKYMIVVRWLKSRKYKQRVLPIHTSICELLQVYTAPMKAEDRVFPISRQRAWQITKRYLKGHPHQLRHSFAVNWLMCGGDIIILHKILGHSKIQTTMEYLKIVPIDQGKELQKITF